MLDALFFNHDDHDLCSKKTEKTINPLIDTTRYKIVVAYDGTDYFGWQVQKEVPSVAQALQDTFLQVFNKPIALYGTSRTDAGVHAMGQIATFDVDLKIKPEKMLSAWTNILPADIIIRSLEPVAPDYNVHVQAVSKTYYYHFFLNRPLPFVQRYGWFYRFPVDLAKLQRCLTVFIGTHDFRSFCTGDEMGQDTVRRIDAATVTHIESLNMYRIAITGPKFMRYMIRRIVGACLEVASRPSLTERDIITVLEAKNPEHTLPNAPAKGLMLYKIVSHDELKERDHE